MMYDINPKFREALMKSPIINRVYSLEQNLSKFQKPSLKNKIALNLAKDLQFNDRLKKYSRDENFYLLPRNEKQSSDFFEISNTINSIRKNSNELITKYANELKIDTDIISNTINDFVNDLESLKTTLFDNNIRFVSDIETV